MKMAPGIGEKLGTLAEMACAVLLVASVWASAHYVVLPVSYVRFDALGPFLLTVGICVAFAVLAWRANVGYRTVYGVFAALVSIGTIGSLVSGGEVVIGRAPGVGALLVGAVLVHYHPRRAFRVLCAGLAGASVLYPLARLAVGGDETLIGQLLTLTVLCISGLYLTVVGLRAPSQGIARTSARQAWTDGRDDPVIAILSQAGAVGAAIALLLLFFVGFGVFETFAISSGVNYPVSTPMMALVVVVALAIVLVDRVHPISNWVTQLVLVLVALFIAGLLVAVLVNDLPSILFDLMYTVSVVVHILVWAILVRLSRGKTSLAVFLFAVATGGLYFAQMAGHMLMRFAITSMGVDGFRISVVAAVLLATLTLCMGAILMRGFKRGDAPAFELGKLLGMDGRSEAGEPAAVADEAGGGFELPLLAADPDKAVFMLVGERYGLSKQEIVVMCLYARGRSVRVISEQLHLAQSTIRTYIQRLYGKLDVHDKQGMLDVIEACRATQR